MNYTNINKILKKKSKDELIELLNNLIQSNPSLVSTIEFHLSNMEKDDRINLEPIKRKILSAVYGNLDYYNIDGALEILYEVQKLAESLLKKSKFKSAVEIYFLLVEGCVDAYDEGADDSSGWLGDFAEECVLEFNKCMKEIKDEGFKASFIDPLLELYFKEDYGFDAEVMFESIVTKDNIGMIEKEVKDYIEISENNHISDYTRIKVKKTIINLYKLIKIPDKSLEIALKGMKTAEDYKLAAEMLVELEKYKEALDYIRYGLKLKNTYSLYEIYFNIIDLLVNAGQRERIDINEVLTRAISFISSRRFNVERYRKICGLFSKLNAKEHFKKTIFNKLEGEILVEFLLEEDEILSAAEAISNLKKTFPNLALSIAHKAKKNGLIEIAQKMIILAFKNLRTFSSFNEKDENLIREILNDVSIEELNDIIPNLKVSKKNSLLLAEVLSIKAPHLVWELIKNFEDYEGRELFTIANNLVEHAPKDAIRLCEGLILKFVIKSHVYYDDVVKLLGVIKRGLELHKNGWKKYILEFTSKFKTRKKLIQMIKDADLT